MFSFSPSAKQSLFPSAPSAVPAAVFTSGNPAAEQLSTPNSHPFQYIQQCYDPASPHYRFRFYFYNYIPPSTLAGTEPLQQPTKPANVGDKLWAQAQADNPDPTKYIPVLASGFDALRERASWQSHQFQLQTQKIQELQDQTRQAIQGLDLDGASLLADVRQREVALARRLIRVMHTLNQIKETPSTPSAQQSALLADLLNRVQTLREFSLPDDARPPSTLPRVAITDADSLARLHAILKSQQEELSSLLDAVQRESRQVEQIGHVYEQSSASLL